jgi:hypothetical protein
VLESANQASCKQFGGELLSVEQLFGQTVVSLYPSLTAA